MAQLKISELSTANKDLTEKVATLTVQLNASCGSRASRKKKINEFDDDEAIRTLAKKFAVTQEFWLEAAVFAVPLLVSADPRPKARFADDDLYDQGTLEILHQFVPA